MAILTEEQSMLRDSAREWVRERAPVSAFRRSRDAGQAADPALYAEMVSMGWVGIVVPEEFGGSGMDMATASILLEELGRSLVSSPFASTAVCGATAINKWGSEAQKKVWLPRIASGKATVALAIDEGHRHAPERNSARATADGDGYRLTGRKTFVADGRAAGLFIVQAITGSEQALFLVPGDANGVTRATLDLIDQRDYAEVAFSDVRLGSAALLGSGSDTVEGLLEIARAAVSAELLGLSTEAFDVTLAYLKTREQFGTILARFQALQHRMANLFTRLQLLRSTVEYAARAIDAGSGDVAEAATVAKALAGEVANLMTREMIQLHGGIGMTDVHDAGLYYKRSRALENMYGSTSQMVESFARMNGF